jgi:cholesterol transport system auxiliary component
MISLRQWARVAALVLTAGALSACITLLPKAKPAQLYRFDGRAALMAAAAPAADKAAARPPRVGIARAPSSFQAAASSDRILTVTGSQVSYLAGNRWSGPAQTLWDEALLNAFDTNAGPARMVSRGEPAQAIYTLRLDVSRFEADYDQGPKAPPKVVIEAHAELIRAADRMVVGDKIFRVEQRAAEDRVSAIVAAFDQAVGKTLAGLLAWTDKNAAAV